MLPRGGAVWCGAGGGGAYGAELERKQLAASGGAELGGFAGGAELAARGAGGMPSCEPRGRGTGKSAELPAHRSESLHRSPGGPFPS